MAAQIFYSLSERHTHRDFSPSDIKLGGLPRIIGEALSLVVNHAAHLPKLHRDQASPGDTSLLLVSLSLCGGSCHTTISFSVTEMTIPMRTRMHACKRELDRLKAGIRSATPVDLRVAGTQHGSATSHDGR